MGDPVAPPNKFKMTDGGHLEFRELLISPLWMKVYAANQVGRYIKAT